jgi:hypothetical protein
MSACKATLHARPFAKITRFLAIFASPGILHLLMGVLLHLLMGVSVAVLSIPTLLRGGSRTTTATRLSWGDDATTAPPAPAAMPAYGHGEFKLP